MEILALILIAGAGALWYIIAPPEKTAETQADATRNANAMLERSASPAAAVNADSFWLGPSQTLEIAGFLLRGPMVYTGQNLARVSGYGIEPALIDPGLRVTRAAYHPENEEEDYFPAYRDFTPAARGAYLRWLSCGKLETRVPASFPLLFFYGLERRLFADTQASPAAESEREVLLGEVRRVLETYRRIGAIRHHATQLLEVQAAVSCVDVLYAAEPDPANDGRGPGVKLRLALSQLARDEKPFPFEWAWAWLAAADNENGIPRAAQDCAGEYRALLAQRYEAEFGDGPRIATGSRPLRFFYRPASPSFRGEIEVAPVGLTDVFDQPEPFATLRGMACDCANALAEYRRAVAGGLGPTSFRSLALLPPDFSINERLANREAVEHWLNLSTVDGPRIISLADLFACLGEEQPANLSRHDAALLAMFLERLRYGFEPNVRAGAVLLQFEGKCLLFRPTDALPREASVRYRAASALLHLNMLIRGGEIEHGQLVAQAEQQALLAFSQRCFGLSAPEMEQLAALASWLGAAQPVLNGCRDLLGALSFQRRMLIGEFLTSAAELDPGLEPRELDVLNAIHRRLKLSTQTMVLAPALARGSDSLAADARLYQTDNVLASVGDVLHNFPRPPVEKERTPGTLPGLDPGYSMSLYRILQRDSWRRTDLENETERADFELDRMIDAINAASYEFAARPLLAGDDPVVLDAGLARDIMY